MTVRSNLVLAAAAASLLVSGAAFATDAAKPVETAPAKVEAKKEEAKEAVKTHGTEVKKDEHAK